MTSNATALTGASVLRRRRDVRFRVIDGEAVVVRQETAEVLGLDPLGSRLLERVDGRAALGAIAAELAPDYDVEPARLERDLIGFAEELVTAGVLELADPTS